MLFLAAHPPTLHVEDFTLVLVFSPPSLLSPNYRRSINPQANLIPLFPIYLSSCKQLGKLQKSKLNGIQWNLGLLFWIRFSETVPLEIRFPDTALALRSMDKIGFQILNPPKSHSSFLYPCNFSSFMRNINHMNILNNTSTYIL